MKNFFSALGILTLLILGFFYKEQTTMVMKNMDEIMIQIKEDSKKYEKLPIEATIKEKEIVPGLSGKEVDINKSYRAMKNVGYFNENLLEYKEVKPNISIKNNYNYYIIGGNSNKNMVSLLFKVDKNTDKETLEEILNIGKIKKVAFTFFIDGYWFEENNDFVSEIARLNHDLGNLGYHGDYTDSSFIWMSTIMKKLTNKKYNYCYMEEENKKYLDICSMHKNYTIRPNLSITENPYITVKEKVKKGDIIVLKINSETLKELPSILTYLQNKGLNEVSLSKLLDENE